MLWGGSAFLRRPGTLSFFVWLAGRSSLFLGEMCSQALAHVQPGSGLWSRRGPLRTPGSTPRPVYDLQVSPAAHGLPLHSPKCPLSHGAFAETWSCLFMPPCCPTGSCISPRKPQWALQHSVNKRWPGARDVPGSVLGTWDTVTNKTDPCLRGAGRPVGGTNDMGSPGTARPCRSLQGKGGWGSPGGPREQLSERCGGHS